jgi:catechol 2,3-dioxygenase-like lactoylglutathione lyase family enzyme
LINQRPVQTTIPVSDVEKAAAWYEETLGFRPGRRLLDGIFYEAGDGTRFQLYETPNAGKSPATVMGLITPDIEADVRDLKGRGAVFEEYDLPGIRTVDSIATTDGARAAWFKDPDGNILGFLEMPD